jgi:hypothetical protein
MSPEHQNEQNYYSKSIDVDQDEDRVIGIVRGKLLYKSATAVNKIDY